MIRRYRRYVNNRKKYKDDIYELDFVKTERGFEQLVYLDHMTPKWWTMRLVNLCPTYEPYSEMV